MKKLACTLLFLSVALLGVGTAAAQDSVYDVGYFTNAVAGAPAAHLRLANDGDASGANLCANIYVFNNAEEMQECCSCQITANGYLDLTVSNSLLTNILDQGIRPTRGVIKEVSSLVPSGGVCNPTAYTTQDGIKGWLTHVQRVVVTQTDPTYSLTETALTDSSLSSTELSFNLQETCSFVESLGTGTGVCSCVDQGD
jgi:hypothetical protein